MPHSSTENLHSGAGSQAKEDPRSHQHDEKASSQQPQTSVHPVEPEDKRSTGTNRPEQRETLQQNVGGGQAQQHPDTPAGQHATGSFPTGTERK